MTKALLKKDKDHDVLGNKINPRKIIIPPDLIKTIVVDGKKLFFTQSMNQFQCAKCLYVYSTMSKRSEVKPDNSKERVFYIEDDCYCNNNQKK